MQIKITDLCGRVPERTIELCELDDNTRSVLEELMDDNDSPWFIGEYQYSEIVPLSQEA